MIKTEEQRYDNVPFAGKMDRSNLLDVSSWLVENLRYRLDVDRFREREGDAIRLQYIRALVAAVQAHNSILKDEELEDIKTRMASIEAALEPRK